MLSLFFKIKPEDIFIFSIRKGSTIVDAAIKVISEEDWGKLYNSDLKFSMLFNKYRLS
jgi:hypothetical protein